MILSALSAQDPEKIALREDKYEITYGNLRNSVELHAEKMKGHACIALLMNNSIDWVIWDLAAMSAGVALVPLPPFFTKEQREHAMKSAGCSAIITPDGIIPLPYAPVTLPAGTAKITFTSGTTGTPKGVCLSQKSMERVAQSLVDVLGKDMAGIHTCVLPLGVLLENVAGVYTTLLAGGTVNLVKLESFGDHYTKLHQVLFDTNTTSVILVPEILRILMSQTVAGNSLPHLNYVAIGGSKVSPWLIEKARQMGLPVYEGYGLSECASVVALNTPKDDRVGTTGKILPHIECVIKNGELLIRNIGFLGYIGEQAPDIIPTGDIGNFNTDGFLSITGRKKNVLITSFGRNISPEWVEAELLAQPEIAQAVVYGDAEPYISAFIVPSSPNANVADGITRANKRLPDYAQVKSFQSIPPLYTEDGTLTGTGRPRRSRIFQLYQKEKNHAVL